MGVITNCDRLSASSCTDLEPEILLEISGSTLVGTPPQTSEVLDGSDCTLNLDQEWQIDDNGESGQFTIALTMSLQGDGCEQFNADVGAGSPNGKGLEGCVITQEVPLEFDAAR